MPEAVALEVENVAKRHGNIQALSDVTMRINQGEAVALLGRNGAGKTSLLSIVTGLMRADSGRAAVFGLDPQHQPRRVHALIGFAPQELGVYGELSVVENLQFWSRFRGLNRAEEKRDISWLLSELELESLANRQVRGFSTGERRRLHVAIAMLGRPPLLLLDEPTAGSDVTTRDRILALVRQLAAEGTAVCYSTHYLPEVESLDARVVLLHKGEVLADAPVQELITQHSVYGVRMRFRSTPPALAWDGCTITQRDNAVDVIDSVNRNVGSYLQLLGRHRSSLLSVDILQPDLDTVFRRLTDDEPTESVEVGQ